MLTRVFPSPDLDIVLLGDAAGALGGSEYLKMAHGLVRGRPAPVDLDRERALQALLVEAAAARWIGSAHDCAEGGLAVTLAECCIEAAASGPRSIWPEQWDPNDKFGVVRLLFGEAPSRVVVSAAGAARERLLSRARALRVPAAVVGRTGGDRISVAVSDVTVAAIGLDAAEQAWGHGFARHFDAPPAVAVASATAIGDAAV